jgi:hypothetical protein
MPPIAASTSKIAEVFKLFAAMRAAIWLIIRRFRSPACLIRFRFNLQYLPNFRGKLGFVLPSPFIDMLAGIIGPRSA